MKTVIRFTLLLAILTILPTSAGWAADDTPVPVPGMVTVVDLGAKTCIPCKMMAPILTELAKKYEGKAAIIFIDVREKPEEGKRFQVSAIPTQIFFDQNGQEVYRHLGFLDKQAIIDRIDKMMGGK